MLLVVGIWWFEMRVECTYNYYATLRHTKRIYYEVDGGKNKNGKSAILFIFYRKNPN